MLVLNIPEREFWNEEKEEFFYTKKATLRLEHSLISLSKWESKWCKPFLSSEKTDEETLDYIRCMTLNQDVDPDVYHRLTGVEIKQINEYIAAPMTASTVTSSEPDKKNSNTFVTSELIYYWMIAFNIPVEFEKWHLNRLIMLIRICSEESKKGDKKKGRGTNVAKHRSLNEQRRAALAKKGLHP